MRPPRAAGAQRVELVVRGQVVLGVAGGRPLTAEAIGIGGGRVLVAGDAQTVRDAAPDAKVVGEPDAAVVPGLHDFHLHLVGMARQRHTVLLDGMSGQEVIRALALADERGAEGWLRGRGWSEDALSRTVIDELNRVLANRPALVYSHDSHSAWASPAALRAAGLSAWEGDPPGGRIERGVDGVATGILRETATDLVDAVVDGLRGEALDAALDDVARELAAWGVTGATDAGDTSPAGGQGRYAALGDRASALLDAAGRLDGRLRVSVGFPAAAIADAAEIGLVTGGALREARTVRGGWAKAYADGALGSRTAAIFEPYTCAPRDTGILRLEPPELDALFAAARGARIALAVHAIGDRAAASVLDAVERAGRPDPALPPHRVEHLQLLRATDRERVAALGVTASIQPVHCAADRDHVTRCWADRAQLAYPWRSLTAAGAHLAFGSDAPIETPNPWIGMFAAVHRRFSGDGTDDWHPAEALTAAEALEGYTRGPALAGAHADEGHLRPGALADLAMLNVSLATLLAADDRLAEARSVLTLVGGQEVHSA